MRIPDKVKDRIRSHLSALRDCIDGSAIDARKRKKLLSRIDEVERELDRRRTSIAAAALLTMEVLALPGGVWASADVATKLTTTVLQVIGEAKAKEEEAKQIPDTEAIALSPPRAPSSADPKPSRVDVIDDDIPF